jgi:hypothetical protein
MNSGHAQDRISSSAVKVRGTFHAASASTGGALTLRNSEGATITLGPNDRVIVTEASLVATAAGDAAIYFDTNGNGAINDGEEIVRGVVTAATAGTQFLASPGCFPTVGKKGAPVRCVCASGGISAIIFGYVMAGNT